MNPKIVIRSVTDADVEAIAEVTVAAFKTLAISHHTEQYIIAALRLSRRIQSGWLGSGDGRRFAARIELTHLI